MKKTRITRALLVVVALALVCTFVFAACNTQTECEKNGHKGGTATCTKKAVCEVCGEEYGELAAHKGGTAVCGKKAVCEVCGAEYGEAGKHVDADNDCLCDLCGQDSRVYWVNDTKNYTWHVGPSTLPTEWNYHTYESNESTYILDYTSDSLYTFDYNETGDAFQIVPSMASAMPVDVTSEYIGRFGITEGETGRAYQISLKNNLKYDNGDVINANSFVRSVQNLLNPAASNMRAGDLYKTGDLKIYGAEDYVKQGKVLIEQVAIHYAGISEAIEAGDIYISPSVLDDIFVNEWFGGTYAQVKKAGYFAGYFSIYAGEGADRKPTGEDFFTKWIDPLYNAEEDVKMPYTKDELKQMVVDYSNCDDWNPSAEIELASILAATFTYPEYTWDNVGFLAKDDLTLVIILKNAMEDNFYLRYNLGTSFFLVHNGLYEECASTEGGVYTNNYGTSVDTFIGYGPYKLTYYLADSSFKLERNPYWHGYYEADKEGQYQTTAIEYKVVKEDATRLEMFLKGELDSYGLRAEDMEDYYTSKYTYFQESESTWFVAMNPNEATYAQMQEKATPVTAGNTVIKTPLNFIEFRQAMSYSLDRTAFIVALNPTSGVAKGALSSMMVSDPENGIMYRSTEEAKDAILEFWGLADQVGPGKEYETKDEAIESITGYDPAGAKTLFTTAYNKSKEAGFITDEMETSGKWELQVMVGASTWTSKFYANGFEFLSKNWTEAVVGTPFEGHLVFVRSEDLGANTWADALKEGRVDLLFGVGFSGSQFDPYGFMDVFTGSLQYDVFTDKAQVMVDIELDGKLLRGSLEDWVASLSGTAFNASVVGADGLTTDEKVEIAAGSSAEISMRLKIMAKCEVAVLNLCNMLPLMTDASASMRCMRINYKTEEYILGLGRGGIQYYTYTMSDEEFANFVQEQGGTLNYKVSE